MPDLEVLLACEDPAILKLGFEWIAFGAHVKNHGPAGADVEPCDILVVDLRSDCASGLAVLRRALEVGPDLPVVLIVSEENIAAAVEGMRLGAYDVIDRPYEPRRLFDAVRRASERRRLILENRRLHRSSAEAALNPHILGPSRASEKLRAQVAELAAADVSVILYGETGTGKDLAARCMHDFGPRSKGNYVAINCAAIPETIAESELFGHDAGAFTGAVRPRVGRVEHSHGGTLFFDEIESMPFAIQGKVLRVLEERYIQRLGSNHRVDVSFRAIAASKVDLNRVHAAGQFRADLYFRLCVAELHLPPLRSRRDDILPLFQHFARRAEDAYQREARPLSPQQANRLMKHDWPGNIRELRNAAERYVLGLDREPQLPTFGRPHQSLSEQVDAFEKEIIEKCLRESGGRIDVVLKKLGVPRRTLSDKMHRFGVQRKSFVDEGSQQVSAKAHGITV